MAAAATRTERLEAATVSDREAELATKLLSDATTQGTYKHSFMGWVTQLKGAQSQQRILVVGPYRLTTIKKHAGIVKGRSKLSISKHFPFLNLRVMTTAVDDAGLSSMHCSFRQDNGSAYALSLAWTADVAGQIIDPIVRSARDA